MFNNSFSLHNNLLNFNFRTQINKSFWAFLSLFSKKLKCLFYKNDYGHIKGRQALTCKYVNMWKIHKKVLIHRAMAWHHDIQHNDIQHNNKIAPLINST